MSALPHTTSDVDTTIFLAFFGELALVTFALAARDALRRRDVVPVAVSVCALNERKSAFYPRLVEAAP